MGGKKGETRGGGTSAPSIQLLEVLGDDAVAVILDKVTRGGDGPADIARVSCVCKRMRTLALEQMRRMRVLDLTQLSQRARWAAPHLARRCESLVTIVCDGSNVTDENVTALLAASEKTLVRLSLADCRHLRNLHGHVFRQSSSSSSSSSCRLAEINLKGSSWSPSSLTGLLRAARHTLTALNLSSTRVSLSSLKHGDDFGEVSRCILECRGLKRLHLGSPVDYVPACLAKNIFSELQRHVGDGDDGGGGDDDAAAAGSDGNNGGNDSSGGGVGGDVARGGGGGGGETGERFPYFSALEELSLAQNGAADDAMLAAVARHCPALRQLDLCGSSVTADGVASFAAAARCAPLLRSLLLGGCDSLDDVALAALVARLPRLDELDLSMHHKVGPEGIAALGSEGSHLRRLRISRNARVTAASLAQLARGGSVRRLSAVKCRRAGESALGLLRRELEEGARGGGGGADVVEGGDGRDDRFRKHERSRRRPCRVDWVGEDFGWDLLGLVLDEQS